MDCRSLIDLTVTGPTGSIRFRLRAPVGRSIETAGGSILDFFRWSASSRIQKTGSGRETDCAAWANWLINGLVSQLFAFFFCVVNGLFIKVKENGCVRKAGTQCTFFVYRSTKEIQLCRVIKYCTRNLYDCTRDLVVHGWTCTVR